MNYIVLDLEWNQGRDTEIRKDLLFEIIEIGAVKLNRKMEIVSNFNRLIKPQVYKELHYITEKLIRLTKEDLMKEDSFVEVMEDFLEWCGKDFMFATWGPLDLHELQQNMKYYYMDPIENGRVKFLDLQKLFSLAFEDGKIRRTLEAAVDTLPITKDIPFHRALSDAFYTSKIFIIMKQEVPEVIKKVSFDIFIPPKKKREEIKIVFDTYYKYISREFEDKVQALNDKEVMNTRCYVCHRATKKHLKWFSANGKHYYHVSSCKKHGFMKSKVRIKKTEGEKVYIVKTCKLIPEEEVSLLERKQTKAKEYKREKIVRYRKIRRRILP